MWTSARRKAIPGRRKGEFKGPEVGTCLGCWRDNAVRGSRRVLGLGKVSGRMRGSVGLGQDFGFILREKESHDGQGCNLALFRTGLQCWKGMEGKGYLQTLCPLCPITL